MALTDENRDLNDDGHGMGGVREVRGCMWETMSVEARKKGHGHEHEYERKKNALIIVIECHCEGR